MPLQWRNQFWQSLEEGDGKRCLECVERVDKRHPDNHVCLLLSVLLKHRGSADMMLGEKGSVCNRLLVCLLAFLSYNPDVHLVLGEKLAYAAVSPRL